VSPKTSIAVQQPLADNFNAGDTEASNMSVSFTARRWVGGSVGYVHYTSNRRFVGGCLGSVDSF
jgi:hypothetical protein